jgi:hypothetical protein
VINFHSDSEAQPFGAEDARTSKALVTRDFRLFLLDLMIGLWLEQGGGCGTGLRATCLDEQHREVPADDQVWMRESAIPYFSRLISQHLPCLLRRHLLCDHGHVLPIGNGASAFAQPEADFPCGLPTEYHHVHHSRIRASVVRVSAQAQTDQAGIGTACLHNFLPCVFWFLSCLNCA